MIPALITADMPLDYLHGRGRQPSIQLEQYFSDLPKRNDTYHMNSTYISYIENIQKFIFEDFLRNIFKLLNKVIDSFSIKLNTQNHSLSDFDKEFIEKIAIENSFFFLLNRPSTLSVEPTNDDSLFFSAFYENYKIYLETHFDKETNCLEYVSNIYDYDKQLVDSFDGNDFYVYNRIMNYVNPSKQLISQK